MVSIVVYLVADKNLSRSMMGSCRKMDKKLGTRTSSMDTRCMGRPSKS